MSAGDNCRVEGLLSNDVGVLMDDGYPSVKRSDSGRPLPDLDTSFGMGFVVVRFGTFSIPLYPSLINCEWKEIKQ